jgi:hypothetical protein
MGISRTASNHPRMSVSEKKEVPGCREVGVVLKFLGG